eukprot:1021079-Rhodomonas_salina.2
MHSTTPSVPGIPYYARRPIAEFCTRFGAEPPMKSFCSRAATHCRTPIQYRGTPIQYRAFRSERVDP